MHIHRRAKRLAQNIAVFAVLSCGAVLLCAAAFPRHAVLPRQPAFPIYNYQNPFNIEKTSVQSEPAQPRLLTATNFFGWSGFGLLNLAALWSLHRALNSRTNSRQQTKYHATNVARMIGALPPISKPVMPAIKQDVFQQQIRRETILHLRSFSHRKTSISCRSRFRPVVLTSNRIIGRRLV